MRHLDRQQAVRCKQLRQSSDEVVEVRDLGEGVVAGNEVGLAALALELVGKVTSEEPRRGCELQRLPPPRATFWAGSMPSTGTPAATKLRSR